MTRGHAEEIVKRTHQSEHTHAHTERSKITCALNDRGEDCQKQDQKDFERAQNL